MNKVESVGGIYNKVHFSCHLIKVVKWSKELTKMKVSKGSVYEKLTREYQEKYDLYFDFCSNIAPILEQVIKDRSYRYQIVTCRAKKLASASMRFQNKDCKQLSDLKDLAGCRVIFYLESDINKFIKDIYDTFGRDNIVEHENKISIDGYNAVHIVIKLGADRLIHPENKRYEGLVCEIQLTTVLHHAWSEMEHDIVYKPSKELSEFDAKAFEAIREGFKKTMTEHIQPAMRDFEHLVQENEKLKGGKGVFNSSFLKQIEGATSLNELEDNLKLLEQYVKEFGDKTPKELPLITLLKKVLVKAKKVKSKPVKTVLGNFKGTKYQDIALIILSILDTMRYWYIEDICEICFDILKNEKNEQILKKAGSVLDHLSKYDVRILRSQSSYQPQEQIVKILSKKSEEKNTVTKNTIVSMLKEILVLSFSGIEASSYNSVTFKPTSLNATPRLKKLRKQCFDMLKKLYVSSKDVQEKRNIIKTFEHALRWDDHGVMKNSDELNKMIENDSKSVFTFYNSLIETEENEILYEIETHLMFLQRDPERKSPRISRLLSVLSKNNDYQIFKVFVGYDTHFYSDLDFDKAKLYRDGKIKDFILDISETTLKKWKRALRQVTKNYKYSDQGMYNYLNFFLFEVAKQKPEIALDLIGEAYLKPFLIHLVAGIWKSKKKASAKVLLSEWCRTYKNFNVCSSIFDYVEEFDKDLFKKIVTKSIERKNAWALNMLISSIGRNYTGQPWLKTIFLKIISELSTLGNTSWTQYIWYRKDSIMKDLNKSDFKILLKNLILQESINYDTEEILEPFATKYPKDFIRFLLERVQRRMKLKTGDKFSRYDAIPHNFNKLKESLQKNAWVIIPAVLQWYSMGTEKHNQWLYRWEASHFLKEVFPTSNPELEKELIKLIKHGGKDGLMVVDEFISRFEGQDFLWKLVEEVINTYKSVTKYDETKRKLFGYLSQTGVVVGEYGFVEAFKSKKNALVPLKTTTNAGYLLFLNDYETYLDSQIASYQKMADDEIDKRKREYGS
ncbi:MAG: RelA/SpoT domain-containing protein [Candidatus Nomurabacteria bacterium]|nr:RelA/SpoT domain-containing protein [Candidatus Nomurabacteria bacterium]